MLAREVPLGKVTRRTIIFVAKIGLKQEISAVTTETSLLPFYSADATTMLARTLLVLQR